MANKKLLPFVLASLALSGFISPVAYAEPLSLLTITDDNYDDIRDKDEWDITPELGKKLYEPFAFFTHVSSPSTLTHIKSVTALRGSTPEIKEYYVQDYGNNTYYLAEITRMSGKKDIEQKHVKLGITEYEFYSNPDLESFAHPENLFKET